MFELLNANVWTSKRRASLEIGRARLWIKMCNLKSR